jgi:hypothetical protein
LERIKVTEGRKTTVFALIAGAVALLAWVTGNRVTTDVSTANNRIGATLFEKFTDPLEAASLKILKYDNSKEAFDEFEVSKDRKSGLWTIPSHESYPADASKQMADAATLFVGLKVIDVASEKRSDQTLFGVVEPNKQKEAEGGEGVGMLVQLRDEKGEMLADLIIGKEVDGKKRFVRVPSEDLIYVCELDSAPLTTEFKSWIEPDLLKLSSNDIETIGVRDYQIVPTEQGMVLSRNYEADLTFSSTANQWIANRITPFEAGSPAEKVIGAEEQLNSVKLNEIKNTLDNLKIADVTKKPSGLAADLKGDKSVLSNEALTSLARRGFYPNPNQKDGSVVDFYSKSGELQVTLNDGVQYLLRFGGSASADINEAAEEGKEDSVSINRFLLVTARLDESKYPQPQLEKVPESVEELKSLEALKEAAGATSVAPAVSAPGTGETAPPPVNETTPAPAEQPKAEAPSDKPASETTPSEPPAEPKPAEEPKSDQASARVPNGKLIATVQEGNTAADPAAAPVQEPTATPAPASTETKPSAQEITDEEWKERLEAARERITKENTRKIEQREEKMNAAKSKVNELNRRFADWYYVISEADFNKLRVAQKDLVQPKTAAAGAGESGLPGGVSLPGLPIQP